VNNEVARVQVYYLNICQSDAVMIAEIDYRRSLIDLANDHLNSSDKTPGLASPERKWKR
jgi:hypothetical protein